MKYDYIIVGSGLYGAVIAHELYKSGKKCLVIEKRDHIGGNIYTEKVEGIDVHKYGAHIFHTDNKKIWDYINDFSEFNNYINSPLADYKGELYNLPFNMNTFNQIWGVRTPEEAKSIIEQQKKENFCSCPSNLKEQAINLVGYDIYEKLIKGYTEKQWGRSCEELPSFIIKRLPVRFRYDNNYYDSRYQGIPIDGYTSIIEKMIDGSDFITSTDFLENKDKWLKDCHSVIYTGPIDAFFEYRLGELEYRKVNFKTKVIEKNDFQGNAVINYTHRDIPYTRSIEHNHFNFKYIKKTVVSFEYSEEWKRGDDPYYPVNDVKNTLLYQQYKSMADKEQNIIFGGRLGEYKYYDMDKTIEAALVKVKELLEK